MILDEKSNDFLKSGVTTVSGSEKALGSIN
jgi:hypothetical protein